MRFVSGDRHTQLVLHNILRTTPNKTPCVVGIDGFSSCITFWNRPCARHLASYENKRRRRVFRSPDTAAVTGQTSKAHPGHKSPPRRSVFGPETTICFRAGSPSCFYCSPLQNKRAGRTRALCLFRSFRGLFCGLIDVHRGRLRGGRINLELRRAFGTGPTTLFRCREETYNTRAEKRNAQNLEKLRAAAADTRSSAGSKKKKTAGGSGETFWENSTTTTTWRAVVTTLLVSQRRR